MGCYRNNDVAGASNNRGHCNDVAGANDFKVPVYSYIDGEDFCRAVKRCLANTEDDNNKRCCKCNKCRHHYY